MGDDILCKLPTTLKAGMSIETSGKFGTNSGKYISVNFYTVEMVYETQDLVCVHYVPCDDSAFITRCDDCWGQMGYQRPYDTPYA